MTVVEFWVEQYNAVVAEKKTLGDKLREALEENKDLQEQLNRLKDRLTYTSLKNMEMEIGRLKESLEGANKFSDSLQEKLDAADAEKKDLQQKINGLTSSKEAIRSMNSSLSRNLVSSMHQAQELKMQLEAMKKENESLHNVIDSFVDKCTGLENKVEGYENALKDEHERLDKSIADRKELQADRDIWFRKNSEKLAEIEELKRKVKSLAKELEDVKKQLAYFTGSRDGWSDRAKKAEKELEEIKQEFKQSYSEGYSDGNEEGQNELWEMLQMVKDMQPNEFDTECECIGDVIDMDLEDFKEAYSKWEEEQKKAAEEAKKQHVEFMRDYLKSYCRGRLCINCPLHAAVSSCLFSRLTAEEVEKRYNKVIESELSKMTSVPVSARLPQPWECTIEGTFEVNEDILKVVCGIKDDKK